MSTVLFDSASRVYPGSTTPAVDRLDLQINDGEFMALVGPSGCGKSTSLRMLAGLEDVNGGSIRIGDRVDPQRTPHKGATVHVMANPERFLAFDASTGIRLS